MVKVWKFTIVELLIVIAVISILVALLFPALNLAREKARGIKCLSNLKQLGTAFQMYSADHTDYFPTPMLRAYGYSGGFTWSFPGGETVATHAAWSGKPWFLNLLVYGGYLPQIPGRNAGGYGMGRYVSACPAFLEGGNLQRYSIECNSSSGSGDVMYAVYKMGGTYQFNASLDFDLSTGFNASIRKIHAIRNPSARFLCGDGMKSDLRIYANEATFLTSSGPWFGHAGSTSLLLVDGHVVQGGIGMFPRCPDYKAGLVRGGSKMTFLAYPW